MRPTILSYSMKLSEICKKYPELKNLQNREWRINNLYYIKDKVGNRIKYKMNWAQKRLFYGQQCNSIVLKARQLGITTHACIDALDFCLFNSNKQAGIIAHTLNDAKNFFQDKVKYAFDNLHPAIRALFQIVGDSAQELSFKHGSVVRVGTSLRSTTLQKLHISEFGKICAKYPDKAREIITGALNTVQAGQEITIESTAEGREGAFYNMCETAFNMLRDNKEFGVLDYCPFFFSWWQHPDYILNEEKEIPHKMQEYFKKLEEEDGIKLTNPQKWWYVKKYETQQEDMLREFPSTYKEAFLASQVGNWYAIQMKELFESGRVTDVSYDRGLPVHTAWDLGQNDFMTIWFFQLTESGAIRVIDYFKQTDVPLYEMKEILNRKPYTYGSHLWPHDAAHRDRAGITFEMQALDLGLTGIILERHGLVAGINLVRTTLSKMWFDKTKCKEGLSDLSNYKKKWNNQLGGYTSEEVHDDASHGAASMRYLCAGYKIISSKDEESDQQALQSYWG